MGRFFNQSAVGTLTKGQHGGGGGNLQISEVRISISKRENS